MLLSGGALWGCPAWHGPGCTNMQQQQCRDTRVAAGQTLLAQQQPVPWASPPRPAVLVWVFVSAGSISLAPRLL